MMRLFISTLIVLFSLSSFAQESRAKFPVSEPKPEIKIFPFGVDFRYEQTTDLEWATRTAWNLSAGYQKAAFGMLMEYSKFSEESGNATLGTERTHQETVLWGQWHPWRSQAGAIHFSLYGALAVGGYKEEVTTSLSGSSQTDDSGIQWMSGVGAGVEARVSMNQNLGLIGSLEGRGLTAPDFNTNPTWGGVVRLGLILSL